VEEYALLGVCNNCGKRMVHQVLRHNHNTPGPVILLKKFIFYYVLLTMCKFQRMIFRVVTLFSFCCGYLCAAQKVECPILFVPSLYVANYIVDSVRLYGVTNRRHMNLKITSSLYPLVVGFLP
jgi:hypothetical protein